MKKYKKLRNVCIKFIEEIIIWEKPRKIQIIVIINLQIKSLLLPIQTQYNKILK